MIDKSLDKAIVDAMWAGDIDDLPEPADEQDRYAQYDDDSY